MRKDSFMWALVLGTIVAAGGRAVQAVPREVILGTDVANKVGAKVVAEPGPEQQGFWRVGENFRIFLAPHQPAGVVSINQERVFVGLGLASSPRIEQIKRIAYMTRTGPMPAHVNVVLNIYTELDSDPQLGGNDANWYQRCLNGEPLYSKDYGSSFEDNIWNTFATDHPRSPLLFYDSAHSPPGFSTAPTLEQIQKASYADTWASLVQPVPKNAQADSYAYKNMKVEAISLFTSQGSNWTGFKGDLAQLQIELANGESVLVRFTSAASAAEAAVKDESKHDLMLLGGSAVAALLVLLLLAIRWKRSNGRAVGAVPPRRR